MSVSARPYQPGQVADIEPTTFVPAIAAAAAGVLAVGPRRAPAGLPVPQSRRGHRRGSVPNAFVDAGRQFAAELDFLMSTDTRTPSEPGLPRATVSMCSSLLPALFLLLVMICVGSGERRGAGLYSPMWTGTTPASATWSGVGASALVSSSGALFAAGGVAVSSAAMGRGHFRHPVPTL